MPKNSLILRAMFLAAKETVKVMKDENTIMHARGYDWGMHYLLCRLYRYIPQPANIFIYAGNADKRILKSIEAGATVITELADQIYGRSGGVKDPFGNTWWITSVI